MSTHPACPVRAPRSFFDVLAAKDPAKALAESEAVVRRLSTILAEIAMTLHEGKGPIDATSFATLAEKVAVAKLELDLYRSQAPSAAAAPSPPPDTRHNFTDGKGDLWQVRKAHGFTVELNPRGQPCPIGIGFYNEHAWFTPAEALEISTLLRNAGNQAILRGVQAVESAAAATPSTTTQVNP
jgi:hypothetical protein